MTIDNKGQSSAELILLIGGILVIIIVIGTYIVKMTKYTQNNFKNVLEKERDYILNKI